MSMSKVNLEIVKMMKSVVEVCASKYNFDAEEGYRMICESEGLEVKSSSKRSKKISSKPVKSAFPLPYNGEMNGECCMGIRLNSGLYTQCPSVRPEGGAYCGPCNKQATKNEHGLPDYGSIHTRSSKYFKDEEFVDPSGKKPVAYTKVMKKFKVTEEQVREEAAKHNMVLDPRHFVEVEKKSGRPASKVLSEAKKEPKELKAKGRPKKSKKVLELAGEEEDLFASLVMSSSANKSQLLEKVDENEEEIVVSVAESEADSDDNLSLGDVDIIVEAKASKASKPKVSAEEKAALAEQKKLALAEQKAAEKLALAEQKAAEKLALAEQKKAEALAQQNQKKQEAEQKKQALAEQKAALAEQKKLALAEQKKKHLSEAKKEKKVKNDDDADRPTPTFVAPADDADVVKKIMFEGKKYYKSKNTGIIYNMEQDVIGKWNEEKNRIDFDVQDEESEDEYDDN